MNAIEYLIVGATFNLYSKMRIGTRVGSYELMKSVVSIINVYTWITDNQFEQ